MKYYQRRAAPRPRRKYGEKEYRKLNVQGVDERRIAQEKKKRQVLKKALAVASIVLGVAAISAIIPITANAAYGEGYEVYLNGKTLGVVSDPEPVRQALVEIQQDFQQSYGMEIYDDTTLEFKKVRISDQYICPPDVYVQILKQNINVSVMAWVIYVNSRPAAALKTEQEANEVLSRILAPYEEVAEDKDRTQIGFQENVEIVNDPIEYGNVTDAESAYKIMVYGSTDYVEKKHRVVSGDNLTKIARKYGIKVSDLRKANLSVAATDKIYTGDELLIVKPNNRVNVKYVEHIDRVEDYEEEPVIIEDDTKYVTQKYTQTQGTTGKRHITAEVVYINGIEASYEVLSYDVIEPATAAVIVKGTKKVPKVAELAADGGMPFPLEKGTYTISSPFGYRNIEDQVAGASKFHMGIDLAADKGTPIYASYDGTVTFAGSSSGYGLLIKIKHDGGVETRYGHCSQLLVSAGDKVEGGDLIGLVGNTGRSSGSHCHFEIRINGVPTDPQGKYTGDIPGY